MIDTAQFHVLKTNFCEVQCTTTWLAAHMVQISLICSKSICQYSTTRTVGSNGTHTKQNCQFATIHVHLIQVLTAA